MATTVTYKGATLTTVDNQTKVLQTAGTWVEDDFTLVDVSGGGSGLVKLAEYTPSAVRAVKIDLDASWLADYPVLLLVPNLTFASSDWLYINADSTSGGNYTNGAWAGIDKYHTLAVWTLAGTNGYGYRWIRTKSNANADVAGGSVSGYLYYYMYSGSNTMTGTITVYGVSV